MSTLDDLLLQQAEIFEKIQAEKASGRTAALVNVIKLIRDYELTIDDLRDVISEPKSRSKSESNTLKSQIPGAKKRGRPRKIQSAITT